MRPLRLLPLGAVIALLAPAAAGASTWTVDDDGADCPNAGFSSIQAAVEQAAPWDTVVICDGLYLEQSAPTSGNNSPSQPGSQNGVTITKPLTIRGAGADKVTIRPAPAAGGTLAGTAPFLRDGGGNVVTVARQAGGSSDDNENFVDISGVTIDSPTTYAEAGVAFFNTSGRISNSVIGPLLRASTEAELAERPHGWGVIQANSLQGAEAGVRRQVAVARSVVTGYQSGGILFDDARGPDGDTANSVRSGIVAYGHVVGSRIEGSGPDSLIPQTGVRYHAGHRGTVTDSDIVDNSFTPDPRQSVGLLLTDAHTTTDPSNPTVRGFWAINNRFSGNGYALFNADIANAAVREGAPAQATPGTPGAENWWGCSAGPIVGAASVEPCQGISGTDSTPAESVERGPNRTAMQILPTPPGATTDAAPVGSFAQPVGTAVAGEDSSPVVVAGDDFGVKSVSLAVDGAPVATAGRAPYEFSWTPAAEQVGSTVTLEATITDSADQATVVTTAVLVTAPPASPPPPPVEPPALAAPASTAPPVITGTASVGRRLTCTPGSWTATPTAFSFQWLRDGRVVATGSTYVLKRADTASRIACRVVAANSAGSGVADSVARTVRFAASTTSKRSVRQAGPAIVAVKRSVSRGRVTLGSATCVRAAATRCTITITSRGLSTRRVVRRGRTARLTVRVARPGRLELRIAARDNTGFAGRATAVVRIRA
jgi:Big-like domain-containing protein